MDNLTTSIQNNGAQSTATQNDRAQLIKDLESAGVNASTAKTDVDDFITSIGKIPKSVSMSLTETATGTWNITGQMPTTTSGTVSTSGLKAAAGGAYVTGRNSRPRLGTHRRDARRSRRSHRHG